jgi:hypothetical protein
MIKNVIMISFLLLGVIVLTSCVPVEETTARESCFSDADCREAFEQCIAVRHCQQYSGEVYTDCVNSCYTQALSGEVPDIMVSEPVAEENDGEMPVSEQAAEDVAEEEHVMEQIAPEVSEEIIENISDGREENVSVEVPDDMPTEMEPVEVTLWAVGEKGIVFHSTDRGKSWQKRVQSDKDLYAIHFADRRTGWMVGGWRCLVEWTIFWC